MQFKYILLLLISISIASCSDSFIDIPLKGALEENDIKSKEDVENLLTGAYHMLTGTTEFNFGTPWDTAPDNWIYGNIAGGSSHKGSFGGDQPAVNSIERWSVDASNGFLNDYWKVYYEGISRTNQVLSVLELIQEQGGDGQDHQMELDEKEINRIAAEACFLRAHFYFQLKQMFNMIPWIDENTTDFNQPNDEDIWYKIEEDFEFAYNNLPEIQEDIGRANKWAAGAYLVKSYIFQKKFEKAKPVLDDVIENGVTSDGQKYGLVDRYEDNFDAAEKNNKESVFAVQMTANDASEDITNSNKGGMIKFPGNKAPFRRNGGYDQPSIDLVNSFRTDESGLPYINDYNSHSIKNSMGISSDESFTPDQGNIDPRLDWTVGRRGVPFLDWGEYPGLDWVLTPKEYGPFGPKKNVYWQATQDKYADQSSWAPGTALNILIIRYAQVLLWGAETEAELGNLGRAQEYVNLVRKRAGNPESLVYKYKDSGNPLNGFTDEPAANYVISTYPEGYFNSIGQEKTLRAIYFENKLELGMEGFWFFNISRWGIASDFLNQYFDYEGKFVGSVNGASFTEGKNEYFPIPQRQIDLSDKEGDPQLKQNPGY